MGFVKFTQVGKNFAPRVMMHPNGVVHFNQGARQKFNMDRFSHCVMYLDPDAHTIGFELVNDENLDGANRLRRVQREGVDLNARAFLDHFKMRLKNPLSFRLLMDVETEWLMLRLDDGEVMMTTSPVSFDDDEHDDHDSDDADVTDDDSSPRVTSLRPPPKTQMVTKVAPAVAMNGAARGRGVKAMLSELLQD